MIAGRAETDEQKREVIERLYNAWVNVPGLRLGQLIDSAMPTDSDLFYVEDFELVRSIEAYLAEVK